MFAYLDNSATTKQLPEVTQAMLNIMEENYGNPSTLHRLGVRSEKAVKTARKQIAGVISALDEEVYFTSGGTESDNTSIFSAVSALKRQGNHIITDRTEHPAVLECIRHLQQQGMQVTWLDVDEHGFVDTEALKASITDQTILVSVMHVNNETGAVQPVKEIGRIVKSASSKALFHCDAVQSFGKLPINVHADSVDLLAASGHKIHGPRGTGLLYIKKNLYLPPYMYGGGQERGMRSGTENVAGIAGFGLAAETAGKNMMENLKRTTELRDYLLQGIRTEISDIRINSPVELPYEDSSTCSGMPYVLNISFYGTRGEVLLHMLEQSDIYVSTGSACSSNKKGQSHVLSAMGLSMDEIEGALRFSLSPYNTIEELEYTVDKLKKAVADNRKMLSLAGKTKKTGR